jgi:DNA-binding GntR family transcriptional regulator
MSGDHPLPRLQNASLRSQAYDSLLRAIVQCDIVPGSTIRDRELAHELGVSRTPVREALQLLETAGLVGPTARSGWRVLPIDIDDLDDLFEIRRVLEPMGIHALRETGDASRIDRLATFFADFEDGVPPDRLVEYHELDHAFHLEIVALSGNKRAMGFYDVVSHHIDRGRHYLLRADPDSDEGPEMTEVHAGHLAICQAIRDRDFVLALTELESHLHYGQSLMIDHLKAPAQANLPGTTIRPQRGTPSSPA